MIVPHAAQKTEKKVGDASYWMKEKTSTKKSKQTKTKEDVDRKSKIVFILFFFFALLYFSCENDLSSNENKKNVFSYLSCSALTPVPSSLVHRIELQRNRGI